MNPNLTANLRADRELKTRVRQQQLSEVRKQLATAQQLLVKADELMSRIPGSFSEIDSAIADGLYHCKEAIDQIDNHPQPDDLWDVALSELPPTQGVLHPPESAF